MTARLHCHLCTMSFMVGKPRISDELWRCPEPKCGKPFWNVESAKDLGVTCGTRPEYAHMFHAEARIAWP